MAKRISEEIIKQIPALYKELGNKTQVAKELGISVASVNKYLNLIEAAPVERKPRVKVTPELVEQINILYSKCKNMSEVARQLGISSSTVKKHLNEDNLKLIETQNEDRDALFYYIYRLFGQYSEDKPINPWNLTQMQKFRSQGMPYKGQLMTLKYFYEVEGHTTEKAHGSIGIIPFVWSRAQMYYEKQAQKAEQTIKSIQRQLEQDRIEIKYNPSDYFGKKKKKTINLDTLGDD